MKAYELLYILDPTANDEIRANVAERINGAITSQGGEIENIDDWGRRKLAYEIDHLSEGDYILVNFQADPTHVQELDRVLRITDAVKRHMIVVRYEQQQ